MTELYIDGTAAVLGKDFNIQVKRENPLFTKNGEYTYDITLPLDNATNAELYAHLNRLNVTQAVSTDRRAVLVADNRVYCNGTEVITGWTEDTVSIQIASGNSELNWLIGADLQISFLEGMPEMPWLPTVETVTYVRDNIEKTYPEVEHTFFSVFDSSNGFQVNPWWFDDREGSPGLQPLQEGSATERFFPQPFLCAFLKHLFSALGYRLEYNFLEDTAYRYLCLCHVHRTKKWCEVLPGWSVKDFLEQVEWLFNASVVVDERKRSVRLLNNTSFYAGTKTAHLQYVVDEYEAEAADEEDDAEAVQMGQCDVTYSFPDTTYYRTCRLSEAVKAAALYDTVPEDFAPEVGLGARLDQWFADGTHRRTDTIYTDALTGRKAFFTELVQNSDTGSNFPNWTFCDDFADVKREDPDQTVELEIMPVELGKMDVAHCIIGAERDPYTWSSAKVTMPVIGDGTQTTTEDSGQENIQPTLSELIAEGDTDTSESKGKIYLAFHGGNNLNVYISRGNPYSFPLAYTDQYIDVDRANEAHHYPVSADPDSTLRLTDLDRLFWGGYDIDLMHAIKLSSHDPNLYDARFIFEIRNKRYVCKDMEFTLDANGRKGAWTGTFYPIKISDTEADARWILTDGRWRDGGVWLDNGRWLDDPT